MQRSAMFNGKFQSTLDRAFTVRPANEQRWPVAWTATLTCVASLLLWGAIAGGVWLIV